MEANKTRASSLSCLASNFESSLMPSEFLRGFFFSLQMEIVPYMVRLKTLISAELFITGNVV